MIGVYLESIISLIKQPKNDHSSEWSNKLESIRSKLQNILQNSSNYRVQSVLGKIKEYESYLQKECAILYGKVAIKNKLSCNSFFKQQSFF